MCFRAVSISLSGDSRVCVIILSGEAGGVEVEALNDSLPALFSGIKKLVMGK